MERHNSGGQQRSVTGPPALHIQTGVQPQPPVQAAEPQQQFPPRKSSMTNQERPDLTKDPVAHPPRTSSRPESPAVSGVRSPMSAGGSQPKIIRPSEIYRRMEEDKERERRSMDSARRPSTESTGVGVEAEGPEGAVKSQRRPSFGRNDDGGGDGGRSLQPLATVDERRSEYGFDGLMAKPGEAETTRDIETRPDPQTSLSSQPHPPTLQHPQPSDGSGPKNRFSTSPKLPDLSRMSGFGSDFFTGAGGIMGGSPKQPAAPAEATQEQLGPAGATHAAETGHGLKEKERNPAERYVTQQISEPSQPRPRRPAIPGGWVSETGSTPGETMATPSYGFGPPDRDMASISEHQEDFSLKPAPLRTPTPRDRSPKKVDEERGSNKTTPSPFVHETAQAVGRGPRTPEVHTGDQQASEATPAALAPLQPRKGSPPANFGQPTITRADTVSTGETTSPLGESDVLRDEIMRSLSPVRSSNAQLDAPPGGDGARESAYLSDVYGDYWTPEDPGAGEHGEKDVGEPKPLAAVEEEFGSASATPIPPTHEWTPAVTSSTGDRSAIPAGESEAVKPVINRDRFSWEAGSEQNTPASPKKYTLPELLKNDTSAPSAGSELPNPVESGRLSPLVTLPALTLGHNDSAAPKEEHAVSAVSTYPPGQDAATVETPSPASHVGPSGAANRGSMFFSPADERILDLQSPTTPTSPSHDELATEAPHADSPLVYGEEPAPTNIPLPGSPTSPTIEATTLDDKPSPSSPQQQQHILNLKQIMALPTSPERVYKMLETRAEFASMPSGLAQWLAQLLAEPEHANAGPGFKYPPAGDDLPLFANQKYYRKHSIGDVESGGAEGGAGGVVGGGGGGLRQSTGLGLGLGLGGSGGSGGGGSVRIPGASAAQAQLGNLMHGQAGVKGKELLQSAGKMGKGLLSKGKNKLRERTESKNR